MIILTVVLDQFALFVVASTIQDIVQPTAV